MIIGLFWGGSAIIEYFNKRKHRKVMETNVENTSKPSETPESEVHVKPKQKLNQNSTNIEGLILSEEQQRLFEILNTSKSHIFITGKAGTGKSVLLQYFNTNTSKDVVIVAPTGVAALNVGGQTIHSLFRIAPGFVRKADLKIDYKTKELLRHIDSVVIDEVSMVRADLMDAIDHKLKMARDNELPFGGAQLIAFGDVYQLPPVVEDKGMQQFFAHNHGGPYFFNAHVWKQASLQIFELSTIFRQKDERFKSMLNSIRVGNISNAVLDRLNKRALVATPDDGVLTLAGHNATVTEINQKRLDSLPGELHEYQATIEGDLKRSDFPTESTLRLKKGAQVMLLRNDRNKRWVNGTLATIHSLAKDYVKVDIDGIVYSLNVETWKKIRYYYDQNERRVDEEAISSFTQLPLRLAWAITIHKSQGQTYGAVAVDLTEGTFAHGQAYVALSRCASLEGLYLKKPVEKEDIIVDSDIIQFMRAAKVFKPKVPITSNNNSKIPVIVQ